MRLLAGDIGGTKTVLALVEDRKIVRRERYASAQYPDLSTIISKFLGGEATDVGKACFGVAGPVHQDVCQATNLPWRIDARAIERELKLCRVSLVNDFHALSIGITELPPSDLVTLHDASSDPRGPWVVLGAGTGLGEGIIIKGAAGYEILSSEGGHCDFGPRDELELDLWRFLAWRYMRVSY